jgi:hypothetical protein
MLEMSLGVVIFLFTITQLAMGLNLLMYPRQKAEPSATLYVSHSVRQPLCTSATSGRANPATFNSKHSRLIT